MSKPAHITEEEIQQYLRTVEMFEAIAQAQPDDYQSLEILKEAYSKLGRKDDSLRISQKLVAAYTTQGQVFKAILECEGILQESPDQEDVRRQLTQLEAQAKLAISEPSPAPPSPPKVDSKLKAAVAETAGAPPIPQTPRQEAEEGDRTLADALTTEKLATTQALQPLLQKLKELRGVPHPERGMPLSLVQLIVNEQYAKLDDVLGVLLTKSMLPYLPLSNYDVDRDTACLLPLELCWQFCIVPFDQISRCILVATANPFQTAARRTIEAALKANLFWYVSPPTEIATALRRAHRLEGAAKPAGAS